MAGFKSGLAAGGILVGALGLWLVERAASAPTVFPAKLVTVTPNWIGVQGSIVGSERLERDRPIHNLVYMTCERQRESCDFISINEDRPGYITGINNDTLTIRRWDDRGMTADSLAESSIFGGCNYFEIRVLLPSKEVLYTRLPNPKADKTRCAELFKSSEPLRQWRIDNGKGTADYAPGAD